MTQQHIYRDLADAVRAIKTEYNHDVDAIARALAESRGRCFCLFLMSGVCPDNGNGKETVSEFRDKPTVIIEDNTIYQNNLVGLRVSGTTPVLIKNCSIYQNGRAGVFLQYQADVRIEDSAIYQNEKGGVAINDANRVDLTGNRIYQNKKDFG